MLLDLVYQYFLRSLYHWIFSSFTMICLVVFLFLFLFLGLVIFKILWLEVFHYFSKFFCYCLIIYFSSSFSLFPFDLHYTYFRPISHTSFTLFYVFFNLSFSSHFSLDSFQCLITSSFFQFPCSSMLKLLLNLSTELLISEVVIFSSRFSIFILFIKFSFLVKIFCLVMIILISVFDNFRVCFIFIQFLLLVFLLIV